MAMKLKKFFPFILILLSFNGCGIWTDFTTYFNLYYNMTDLFEKAEEEIKEKREDLFDIYEPTYTGQIQQNLTKVIEKCSNILQFNSESAYVDEALLILGKSFYYQKNYQKAIRKFEELLATPQADEYRLEVNLWIAKTEIQLRKYTQGFERLELVREEAIQEERNDLLVESYLLDIRYAIFSEEYPKAIANCRELLRYSEDNEINSLVMFEIGELYMLSESYAEAADAYQSVKQYEPSFETEFAADLNYAIALRSMEDYERAVEILEELYDEDKYSDSRDILNLELGITKEKIELYDEAYDHFYYLDTSLTFNNSMYKTAGQYEMGLLFEKKLFNFDSATVYYQKAALSKNYAPEYAALIPEKDRVFKKYNELSDEFIARNRQMFYKLNPDIFEQDSILYYQDSLKRARERELETLFSSDIDIPEELSDTLLRLDSTLYQLDSLITEIDTTIFGYDTTYFFQRDSLTLIKDSIIGANEELFQQTEPPGGSGRDRNNRNQSGEEPDEDEEPLMPRPYRPAFPIDSLHTLIAGTALELGGLFFIELDRPDSAFYYYNEILQYHPGTSHQPEALFALGSYFSTINDSTIADSLFAFIYDNYQENSIVNAAAAKIDRELIDFDYDPAKDEFLVAEDLRLEGLYDAAIDKLYEIYRLYPYSMYSTKSLYTAGYILEENLELYDSAAVVYDTLVTNFTHSQFAKDIAPKLNFYKEEKERIRQAIEDSIKAVEDSLQALADSIALADSLASVDSLYLQQGDSLLTETPPDSMLMTDSLFTPPDSLLMPPDSTVYSDSVSQMMQELDSLKNRMSPPDSTGEQNDKPPGGNNDNEKNEEKDGSPSAVLHKRDFLHGISGNFYPYV